MKLWSISTQKRICWGLGSATRAFQFYYNICSDKSDFSQDMPQEHHSSVARLKNTAPLNCITVLSKWLKLHEKNNFAIIFIYYVCFRTEIESLKVKHLSIRKTSVLSAWMSKSWRTYKFCTGLRSDKMDFMHKESCLLICPAVYKDFNMFPWCCWLFNI